MRGQLLASAGKQRPSERVLGSVGGESLARLLAGRQLLHSSAALSCRGRRSSDHVRVEGRAGLLSRGLNRAKIHSRLAGLILFPPFRVGGAFCEELELDVRDAGRSFLLLLLLLLRLFFVVRVALAARRRGVEVEALGCSSFLGQTNLLGKFADTAEAGHGRFHVRDRRW